MTRNRFSPVRRIGTLAAAGLLGLVAGCAVGPDYKRPDTKPPAAFKNAGAATTDAGVLSDSWWTLYGDKELSGYCEELLKANTDIRAAMARVDQAHASKLSAGSSFFPSLAAEPNMRRSRATSSLTGKATTSNTYSLPLDLNYEADIWGRLRRQYEYYHNLEAASAEDLAVVRQTALAELAQDYFTLRLCDAQTEILTNAVDLYNQELAFTKTKKNAGLASQSDVLTVQNQVDQAKTQLIEIRRTRAKQENAIAILLSRDPSGFSVAPHQRQILVPKPPAGLPATLLDRRPDVREAEHRLAAANAEIGIAEANFLPTFSLTGSAGYQNSSTNDLTAWRNRVWSISPGLNLPIFEGGKLRAGYKGAKASYAEALANYEKAVLGAYGDVENGLSDIRLLAEEIDAYTVTETSASENLRLVRMLYDQGLASSLQLITANQNLLTARMSKASAENQRLAATVLLIKALGGGWTPDNAKSTNSK
jgi:multidrug efflux system outer membrane protein